MFAGAPIRIIDLAPRTLACVRRQASLLSITPIAAAAPVWSRLLSSGVPHGLPMIYFPDGAGDAIFSEPGTTVQIGLEVHAPVDDPLLELVETPGGRAATAHHPGEHDLIGDLHHAIRHFCARRNERLAGPVLEVHHWHEDVERRLTEIYYLLD